MVFESEVSKARFSTQKEDWNQSISGDFTHNQDFFFFAWLILDAPTSAFEVLV